jgi:uncharacterized protein involved in outer membrane biogenesis
MLRKVLIALVLLVLAGIALVYWLVSADATRAALERQASAWLGQPVRIASASARIFPRLAIDLRDIRIGDPVAVTLAEVQVSTGLRPLLSRRIEDADVMIADSSIAMPLPFEVPTDAGATSSGGGLTIGSIRSISLRDIRIRSRGREIDVSADSALVGNMLTISRVTARSGRTEVEASGTVSLAPKVDAAIEARANRLDLDDLVAFADAFTPDAPRSHVRRSAAIPGRIVAKISAAAGSAAGVIIRNMTATVTAEGERIGLDPIAFELFGGRYTGALRVTAGDTLAVTQSVRVERLDVAQLAAFGGSAGSMTGRLSGSGRFTGRGRDLTAVLASARGEGRAAIADGTIPGLSIVRTVVLFFGRPAADAPPATGERFERIAASFTVLNRVLSSSDLTLSSPDFDVAASGTLALPTRQLDLDADLVLSESLSAQAGRDLYRYTREGNRVVLPATIDGTLDRPRVGIDAAAAVKRGLRNEVERRLKGLMDRLKPPKP